MPSISVVICSYTDRRWDDFRRACASVERQLLDGDELLVVIDDRDALLARARAEIPRARVVANGGKQGLSDAHNTGVAAATGDVVAFLDDDAAARPGWLAGLRATFAGADVAVAGTAVVARRGGGGGARPGGGGGGGGGPPAALVPRRVRLGGRLQLPRAAGDQGGRTQS